MRTEHLSQESLALLQPPEKDIYDDTIDESDDEVVFNRKKKIKVQNQCHFPANHDKS